MWDAFLSDCRRVDRDGDQTALRIAQLVLRVHGIKALLGYRLGRHLVWLRENNRGLALRVLGWPVHWILSGYARVALGIDLDVSADIGPGLYIGHFGNVVVRGCTMGQHCSVQQSTHVEPDGQSPGPTIGDRVWIGAHAQVVGAYQIGDRCTISAGAVVRRDVPSGALYLGNPGRVVMMDYDNSSLL